MIIEGLPKYEFSQSVLTGLKNKLKKHRTNSFKVTLKDHFPTEKRKKENQIRHFYCRNNPAIRAKFLLCSNEKINDMEIYFINKFDPSDNFKDKIYFALKNPYLRKVIKEQLNGIL